MVSTLSRLERSGNRIEGCGFVRTHCLHNTLRYAFHCVSRYSGCWLRIHSTNYASSVSQHVPGLAHKYHSRYKLQESPQSSQSSPPRPAEQSQSRLPDDDQRQANIEQDKYETGGFGMSQGEASLWDVRYGMYGIDSRPCFWLHRV